MKKVIIIFFIGFIIIGAFIMLNFSKLGTRPDQSYEAKFAQSAHYDKNQKSFVNRRQDAIKEMRKRAFSFSTFKEWFSEGKDRSPKAPLPEMKPDLNAFLQASDEIKVIWFGHSTFLLNLQGKIILVDPVFSGSASPFSFMVKRFQKPVLELSELPNIDYIVLSHDHYDHLDMESIKFFQDKTASFIAPLGVGSHLIGWGIDPKRITELDWWQNHQVAGLEFIATPAQHFSGREGFHENSTLWASWVIRSSLHNVYFSGDSGYNTHFKDIGDKYGPFDLAFLENGQYNEKWKEVHMLPSESVQAYFDLKAKRFFPVHWGMFVLAFHTWYDPIVSLQKAAQEKGINLVSPKLGQLITINDQYHNEAWWEGLIPR